MHALSCPKCGAPLQFGATACRYCGVGLAPDKPGERGVRPARPQPPIELPAGWELFNDAWHGFKLAHPAGWRVEVGRGQISVREDVLGLTAAVIWPFKMPRAATAREIAAAFVAAGTRFARGFQAWEQGSTAPDSSRISMRTRQTRGGQPIEGVFNILAEEQNCIIAGYEAPAAVIANRSPLLSQLLSTFRTAELMPRMKVQEPRECAFHFWMPQGWTFEAAINRNTVSGMGIPQFSAANGPQGRVVAAMPSFQFVYQDVLGAFVGGLMGYEVAQFKTADMFCTKTLANMFRKSQKNFRLESVTLRPDLAEIEENNLTQMGYPAGMFETSVAVMETTYDENGARLRQRTRVGTQRQRAAGSLFAGITPVWNAQMGTLFRAPDGELDGWEPILTGILDSVTISPQWQANEQQRLQMERLQVQNYIANAQADMQRRRGQISRTLSETSSLIAGSYWDQQRTYDRLSELRSDGMLGVHNVASDSGDLYKVPYGYDQYWVDGLGNLLGGSWMVQPDIDWKPLTPTGI
jgi:hypothetical protein